MVRNVFTTYTRITRLKLSKLQSIIRTTTTPKGLSISLNGHVFCVFLTLQQLLLQKKSDKEW